MDPSSSTDHSSVQHTSNIFCALDADVAFVSSDNVVFKIHSSYLNLITSTGFAKVSGDMQVGSEPVQLSESSTVLEVLFQFIEPPDEKRQFRHPSVMSLDSVIFFGVAEAAEKYVVYGAMNVCVTQMQQIVSQFPLEILNHCFKHGYTDLADQAAKYSIAKPFTEIASRLTAAGLLPRWLIYYSYWHKAAMDAVCRVEDIASSSPTCAAWIRFCAIYRQQVDANPSKVNHMPSWNLDDPSLRCTRSEADISCPCRQAVHLRFWERRIFLNITSPVAKFSTLVV